MPRIRILKATEDQELYVSNGGISATIPNDDNFHDVRDEIVSALNDSSVEFEIENADARGGKKAAAGGEAGLGGSASPPSAKKRARPARSAAKKAAPRKRK